MSSRQNNELVPAQTRQDVGVPQRFADPIGEGHQKVVAGAVSQAVVHQFEPVDIEVNDGKPVILAAFRTFDRHREMFDEKRPVGQVGEGVVKCLEIDLALGILQFGDVGERRHACLCLRYRRNGDQNIPGILVLVNKLTPEMPATGRIKWVGDAPSLSSILR